MKLNTLFMGSSHYSIPTLQSLIQHSHLCGIVTNPDSKAGRGQKIQTPPPKKIAQIHRIPCFQPSSLKNNTQNLISFVHSSNIHLIVVISYGKILPMNLINSPTLASINLHASLLPKYRGASPIQSALLNQEKNTGVTTQIMQKQIDSGDIIHQMSIPILPNDDYLSLSQKLSHLSARCSINTLQLFLKNSIKKIPQNHTDASYSHKIKKLDGLILWNQSTTQSILQKIKAFTPWPGAYTYYNHQKIQIIHAKPLLNPQPQIHTQKPGSILKFDKQGILIQAKDGILQILSLKKESKKIMDFKDFLNGNQWKIGYVLQTHIALLLSSKLSFNLSIFLNQSCS